MNYRLGHLYMFMDVMDEPFSDDLIHDDSQPADTHHISLKVLWCCIIKGIFIFRLKKCVEKAKMEIWPQKNSVVRVNKNRMLIKTDGGFGINEA